MESNRWNSNRQSLQRSRRCPETNVLYRLVYHYREELQWRWEELFQTQYGALRDEVLKSLDKYLDCGILVQGCARAVCEKCGHSELIAFSCKRRCICSSCDAKRAAIFAEHLNSCVLPPYPISHQVYTIPKRLRPYFKFNRKLNKYLYHAAWGAWQDLIEDELPDCQSGSVMALHTAGDLLNWHPHAHALMLHGALDGAGEFHRLESVQLGYLTRRFQCRVLESLHAESLIDQETVDNMLGWENSGFHVFVGDTIAPSDQEARLFVARYLKKSPVSLQRLELVESGPEPVVRYHSYKENLAGQRDFSPLQFLAELSQHLPDEWEQTVRYMGTLSARTRGLQRAQSSCATQRREPLLQLPEPETKPSRSWAQCMKRIFEIDPLQCSRCGGRMQIKSFLSAQPEIERLCKNIGVIPWRAPPPFSKPLSELAA